MGHLHSHEIPDANQLKLSQSDPASGGSDDSATNPTLELKLFRLNSNSNFKRNSHPVDAKKRPSISMTNNGVTGTYIAPKICNIAYCFWIENIEKLPADQQLEIGCSIFFSMLSSNADIKQLMKGYLSKYKVETMGIKMLDMFAWLIRHLLADNIDVCNLLSKLGAMHQAMGVEITHFDPMLQAMHESFAYYFGERYTIEVKYAFDEIFALAAQIMTGQDLKCGSHLNVLNQQFQAETAVPFLQSLDVCLQSYIGREYLYRYLQQTWCDEMVIFLQTVVRFKSSPSDKERFMIAREIVKTSIVSSADFALNLSFENRSKAVDAMQELEKRFAAKETFSISVSFFAAVEAEIHELISDNHWFEFVKSITSLQGQSCSVE